MFLFMTLAFSVVSKHASAQDHVHTAQDPKAKMEVKKEEMIKKYAWTKDIFEKSVSDLVSVKEYAMSNGVNFILVETKDSKKMYDTAGKVYCADYDSFSCLDFYKLTLGDLSWRQL